MFWYTLSSLAIHLFSPLFLQNVLGVAGIGPMTMQSWCKRLVKKLDSVNHLGSSGFSSRLSHPGSPSYSGFASRHQVQAV